MPKLKTKRGAAKRFKRTGSGRFKRIKSYRRHYLTPKRTKRKRHLRSPGELRVRCGCALAAGNVAL